MDDFLSKLLSMSSQLPKKGDDEDSIVQQAQNSPVRPEYTKLLAQENANGPDNNTPLARFSGAPSAETRALNKLNELDQYQSTPEKFNSFDASKMNETLKSLNNKQNPDSTPSLFNQVSNQINNQVDKGNVSSQPSEEDSDEPTRNLASESAPKPITDSISTLSSAPSQVPEGYSPDLNDNSLKQAQADTAKQRLIGQLLNAGSTIGSGISKGSVEATPIGKNILDNANSGEQNILERRKASDEQLQHQLKQYSLADEKDKNNVNSDASKLAQKVLKESATQAGFQIGDVSKMSASSIEKTAPWVSKIIDAKMSADARRDLLTEKQSIKDKDLNYKRLQQAQSELNTKNKPYVTAKSAQDAATEALTVLDTAMSNPISANAVPVVMARLATHGQRINQVEINKLTGGQSLMDYGQRIAKKIASGTMTSTDYNNFKNLINVYKDEADREVSKHESDAAKRLSQLNGKDISQNYLDLTGKGMPDENTKSNNLNNEDKEAIDWANKNKKDPRAQKILKLHGLI